MAFRWRLFGGGWYEPWNSGIRSLAQSSSMEGKMMSAARSLASAADRGESKYGAAPYTVAAGRRNELRRGAIDRKSTRLNSSHVAISYAVFCLKTKKL